MTNTPLPHDWDQILVQFTQTLAGVEQTLAKATAWEASSAAKQKTESYAPVLADQAAQAGGLTDKAGSISYWVDALESELRVSEELLRVLLTQTETVRHKLADWAGRAIG